MLFLDFYYIPNSDSIYIYNRINKILNVLHLKHVVVIMMMIFGFVMI